MALYRSFGEHNHFSELGTRLEVDGVLKTPAQRKQLARDNLGLSTIDDDGIALVDAALTITTDPLFSVTTTSASTDGGTTVVPTKFDATMTGAGGVGRALEAELDISDVTLGSWSNAARFIVKRNDDGHASGLLSVINAEMEFPGAAGEGTTAIYEGELVFPASYSGSAPINLLDFRWTGDSTSIANGAAATALFSITGVASAADGFWEDGTVGTPANVDEWIRVRTPGGDRWLALFNAIPAS